MDTWGLGGCDSGRPYMEVNADLADLEMTDHTWDKSVTNYQIKHRSVPPRIH